MNLGKQMRSRNSDGNVPNVNWNDDKLQVNWYNSDNANDNLRVRVEVSLKEILLITGFLVYSIFIEYILSSH